MIATPEKSALPPHSPVPGVYRHYRGQQYQVIGMARHSESEEWLVVYQALYGEQGFWVRPLSLWLQPVVTDRQGTTAIPDDHSESDVKESTPRFELIETNGHTLEARVEPMGIERS
jgi:hypothetical protein